MAPLELRDVSFGYPGAEAPVLEGISFTSRPGQITAIIGSTGSGKSTLVNLVPRLVDVTEGAVLIDGVDVRDLDPEMVWKRVGLVPQKPYLFTGTVASNLRYGHEEATDDEMWTALEVAQAADFVRRWAASRPTRPGRLERVGRSAPAALDRPGHHRQARDLRLRRLLLRPRPRHRRPAPGGARALDRGATTLVVAQRVSTIISADQIIVLEDGQMVGIGTHEELLQSCPTYAEIVASQTKQQEAAA